MSQVEPPLSVAALCVIEAPQELDALSDMPIVPPGEYQDAKTTIRLAPLSLIAEVVTEVVLEVAAMVWATRVHAALGDNGAVAMIIADSKAASFRMGLPVAGRQAGKKRAENDRRR